MHFVAHFPAKTAASNHECRRAQGVTVKFEALFAVPAGVVTVSRPVLAPPGTVAEMVPCALIVKLAFFLPNSTAVAPVKAVPVIVTTVPTRPLVGANAEMVGSILTVKVALVAVPPGAVTAIGPTSARRVVIRERLVADHPVPSLPPAEVGLNEL